MRVWQGLIFLSAVYWLKPGSDVVPLTGLCTPCRFGELGRSRIRIGDHGRLPRTSWGAAQCS